MSEIKTQGLTEFIREDSPVDTNGRGLINHEIYRELGNRFLLPLDVRSSNFDWRLVTRQGKIAKRIKKYFRGIDRNQLVTDSLIQDIGGIARDHATNAATYHFDIVNHANWAAGDFGDSGSCFWGHYRPHARDMLMNMDNGGLAVRFFKMNPEDVIPEIHKNCCGRFGPPDYKHFTGIGRAWILPYDSGYTIFNSYGGNKLVKVARILAAAFDMDYKEVTIENNGSNSGDLWLNHRDENDENGPALAYHLFAYEERESIPDFIDFMIESPEQYYTHCEECGDGLNEGEYHSWSGSYYCESCVSEYTFVCPVCHDMESLDEAHEVSEEFELICDYCYTRNYGECDRCNDSYRSDELTTVQQSSYSYEYCESCVDYHAVNCEVCDVLYTSERIAEHIESFHPELIQINEDN